VTTGGLDAALDHLDDVDRLLPLIAGATVHPPVRQSTLQCDSSPFSATVHPSVRQSTLQRDSPPFSATVHPSVRQFTLQCDSLPSSLHLRPESIRGLPEPRGGAGCVMLVTGVLFIVLQIGPCYRGCCKVRPTPPPPLPAACGQKLPSSRL
jgi:hypothetical protein